ncbi:hypothetical protein BN59_01386 [Legionella massiliensis]|uniref:Uncharacterized protein n=1 Tax=Legionella massiliensis TaxID=1034943 RepID=A0A078KZA3_9GAMM|nr:hypothetical protein [Legionella massiliensis]CDZ77104.1 hypothetical protein BN59_01386 [Legionella massiliensis]CEE12842.1 hypothetical protein BN1094_01386 [Legionella massiliensis]
MHSLLESLEHFDSYIRGGSSKYLKKYMHRYDDSPEILDIDFHRLRISDSPAIRTRVLSILKNLNIPKKKRKTFNTNITVYELLTQLSREGHPQVDYLLDLIDDKSKISKWGLVLVGGVLASIALYFLSLPAFKFVIDAIKVFASSVISIPIVGLVYNVGLSLYYFFDIYTDNRKTEFNRWRDSFFQFLNTSANIAAYILLIATSAAASPVVGGLYVAAAAVDALKEAFCLVQEFIQYLTSPPIDEADQLSVHRAYARRVFGFEMRRNALGINLAAALLLVGITALWCFLPGGIPATIVAFSAIGLVYLVKYALLKWNEEHLREHLQDQLAELEDQYSALEDSSELDFDQNKDRSLDYDSSLSYSPASVSSLSPTRSSAQWQSQRTQSAPNLRTPLPSAADLPFFGDKTAGDSLVVKVSPESDRSECSHSFS